MFGLLGERTPVGCVCGNPQSWCVQTCCYVRRMGFGYSKRIWRINENERLEYLNLLMWIYDICYVMHGSVLSYESNCVLFLCYVYIQSESVCYTLCKNSYDSSIIVLWIYDLLFTMIIIGIAHVDGKGSIDLGFVIYDLVIVKLNTALLDLPTLSQGAKTWFQHHPILLRVRLWPEQAGHCWKGQ